jgi:hypothetical protein
MAVITATNLEKIMAYHEEFRAPSLEEAEALAYRYMETLSYMQEPRIERSGLIEHPTGRQEHYVIVKYYTLD